MQNAHLVFEKQWIHIVSLGILLSGMILISQNDDLHSGHLWGVSTPAWFWLAVGLAIIHQVYVWFCWRMLLHVKWCTENLGGNQAFTYYSIGFATIGLARMLAVFLLAISNEDSLLLNPAALKILAIAVLIPALYTFYSIIRYFSFRRAFGIDHFDESYQHKPFERRGIFRFTRNGMYTFGFLFLWAPAFWWASLAALSVAAFNHLYIWVHYVTTELPDMKRIYRGHDFKSSN